MIMAYTCVSHFKSEEQYDHVYHVANLRNSMIMAYMSLHDNLNLQCIYYLSNVVQMS